MNRRLFLLNGLAIFAVVCNHAAGWGFTALFWWVHRYRPVTAPNFDAYGSPAYWVLVAMKELTVFSVPAFLFASGAFSAYAGRSAGSAVSWKAIRTRVISLLIPYAMWSVVMFLLDIAEGNFLTPLEYLRRLLFGQAVPAYFYVPALVQLVVLSFWIVPWTKARPTLTLAVTGIIQVIALLMRYAPVWFPGVRVSGLPEWVFINWVFFFTAGVAAGFHLHRVTQTLTRLRWVLFAALLFISVAAVIEPERLYQSTGFEGWRGTPLTISTTLYAILFMLCFTAFENLPLPRFLNTLGSKSYGIYLTHVKIMELTARTIYHVAPFLLASQLLLQPVLIVSAVVLPLALMQLTVKTPARKVYRYVFG